MVYKIPLLLTPQPEGGYTVTSPALPELITEGDSIEDAYENARDALEAVIELYEDVGKEFPRSLLADEEGRQPIAVETLMAVA